MDEMNRGSAGRQPAANKPKKKLSRVSMLHYFRLVYRSSLFIWLLIVYILYRFRGGANVATIIESRPIIIYVIWIVFMFEMAGRFFPSKLESPGCQKQFARNYVRTGKTEINIQDNNGVMLVALIWIAFNGVFGALYMLDVLDDGEILHELVGKRTVGHVTDVQNILNSDLLADLLLNAVMVHVCYVCQTGTQGTVTHNCKLCHGVLSFSILDRQAFSLPEFQV